MSEIYKLILLNEKMNKIKETIARLDGKLDKDILKEFEDRLDRLEKVVGRLKIRSRNRIKNS